MKFLVLPLSLAFLQIGLVFSTPDRCRYTLCCDGALKAVSECLQESESCLVPGDCCRGKSRLTLCSYREGGNGFQCPKGYRQC
uniref:NIP1 type IV n=1 Tax=Rhynchosporium secalis TaxID=38038 RepID=A6ZIN6_RHYSE|nr:NIP1 type IV [Rhynchosporium secalis]